MSPSTAVLDRACGTLLGAAVGAARGARGVDSSELIDAAAAALGDHSISSSGAAGALATLVRHAITHGRLDLESLSARTPELTEWIKRLESAEAADPSSFSAAGSVDTVLLGAWSAVQHAQRASVRFAADRLARSVELAAAPCAGTAGLLAGSVHGASAVPAAWRRALPGLRARQLVAQAATLASQGGEPAVDYSGYTDLGVLARHPYDDGVWLGGVGALDDLPARVDAVVSLCLVPTPPPVAEFVEVRLIDSSDPEKNRNLDFVLDDTVTCVQTLRAEGQVVLVHCVQAHSRTPTVATLYGMRLRSVSWQEALDDVVRALPRARPNPAFQAALARADR